MSRKDGVLALLVVVVWGLNFVVIKVHATADAGRFALYAGRLPGNLFRGTTKSTAEFTAGVWFNHQFCTVCLSLLRH